jgi:DNA polymerase-3 subunit gamma/tau
VARILAYEVNGLPYETESTHLDIIEIDAASNRRIDEIRDLRDKVHISPTSAKYKVYIIDEVHMLTREAFNALLKTLEEPPAHVIFILATTESHKLPETIISRTQRHNFKAVSSKVAADHLAQIANMEKIKVDEPSLQLLAQFGDGSFRDSISLLDQLASGGQSINEDMVRQHLGLPTDSVISDMLAAVEEGNAKDVLNLINAQREQAVDAAALTKLLADKIRQEVAAGDSSRVKLLRALLEVPASQKPFDALEIALLESTVTTSSIIKPSPVIETQPSKVVEVPVAKVEDKPKPVAKASRPFDEDLWADILTEIKSKTPALYTAVRLASPSFEGDSLTLAFEFPLHQKKVNQAANKDILGQTIEKLTGNKVSIDCIVEKSAKKVLPAEPAVVTFENTVEPPQLKNISNIFGSAEVLES